MSYQKRTVEHYKDHELVCLAELGPNGWTYSVSVVTHTGDDSDTRTEQSDEVFPSEIDALRAGISRGKQLVDAQPTNE